MGLLDQILNEALGASAQGAEIPQAGARPAGEPAGQSNQLLDLALAFVRNYPGGLSGLVQQFNKAGFGPQARSWVSTGQNQPISPGDLSQVLGQGEVESMGQQSGLPPKATAGGLAALIPVLIDQLTP